MVTLASQTCHGRRLLEVMPGVESAGSDSPVVGLINLMPYAAQARTQRQWAALLGANLPLKFDDDPWETPGCRSAEYVADYVPFTEAADQLDAVVVTGANLELPKSLSPDRSGLLPLDQIRYIRQLHDVINWSLETQKLTVYSCLASHIALNYLFGLERDRGMGKSFGVYEHEVTSPGSELVAGVGETLRAPHSRWGDIPAKLLEDCGVEVVAVSDEIGWLVARYENSIFMQGHPEYSAYDLAEEYARDSTNSQAVPEHYFPEDNPDRSPAFSWQSDCDVLFTNIRQLI